MPVHECTLPSGAKGYKWGYSGKCYADRKDAEKQAEAIYANGWTGDTLASDGTMRSYDANGWLRIARSHISKACVNPYYGREIPGGDALGLDPERVYYLFRSPEELAKGAASFKGLPILAKHTPLGTFDTLEEKEKKKYIVGAVGSDVEFLDPYLDADTTIWDASAIAGIETDIQREHSCSYRYVPIMTTGEYNGQKYDGIMTQIQGNHLALVESGRAGADVLAADNKLEREPMKRTKLGNALIVALTTAFPKVQIAQDSAIEKALGGAKKSSFDKPGVLGMILAMDAEMPAKEKEVKAVMDALVDVDDPEPTKKDDEDEESAEDEEEHPKGCMCGDCKTARDEDPEEEREKREREEKKKKTAKDKKAKDGEPASKSEMKGAMDALESKLRNSFRESEEAKREVRPLVGEILAQDSAADIYGFALDHMKVDRTAVEGVPALRALFKLAASSKQTPALAHMAMDSAGAETKFPGLARLRQI